MTSDNSYGHPRDESIQRPPEGSKTRAVVTRMLIAGVVVVLLTVLLVVLLRDTSGDSSDGPSSQEAASADGGSAQNSELIVREDSRRLDDVAESDVTFVEFLDFECEACASVYPAVEGLREQYDGEVSFVVRYFPLDGHPNSREAARAVEAAARQGELEAMYQRMYETQEDWSHKEEPQDEVFRGFAEDLDLDVEQWEADYNSEEVAERIQADVDDALELGLQGTPSFFINGQQVQPDDLQDLTDPLDEALEAQ